MVLQRIGKVCSNKMDKTVVVIVELRKWVNKYQTWQRYLRKYMAHDGSNTCNIGDVVKIEQLPHKLSARKAFNVIEILQRERIVTDDGEARYDASVFKRPPKWAHLPPAAQAAMREAVSDFERDHGVTAAAREVARSQ